MSLSRGRTILAGLMLAAPWPCLALAGEEAPAPPAETAEPALPSAAELRELVRQLGDESFAERQKAEDALREIGLPSREALEAGLASDDLQIRRTCQLLLNDILDLDYRRRLDRFLADKEGRLEHDLPGWRRFRKLAGDDAAARKLFGEMHQQEGPLLISAEAGSQALADALDVRLRSIYQAMRRRVPQQRVQPSASAVTALLFVASDPAQQLPQSLLDSNYWLQIVNSSNHRTSLTKADAGSAERKILGQWLLWPGGQQLLNQKLQLALQFDLPEGRELGLKTLSQGDKSPPGYACYAIEAVGRLSEDAPTAAARIAPLLTDERAISRQVINKVRIEIQVRDVALGWLVYLTEQNHAEYHMPRAKTVFDRLKGRPRGYSVSYPYMRFEKPEDRPKALAKWKQWVAEHPLPEIKPAEPDDAEGR